MYGVAINAFYFPLHNEIQDLQHTQIIKIRGFDGHHMTLVSPHGRIRISPCLLLSFCISSPTVFFFFRFLSLFQGDRGHK